MQNETKGENGRFLPLRSLPPEWLLMWFRLLSALPDHQHKQQYIKLLSHIFLQVFDFIRQLRDFGVQSVYITFSRDV